MFTVCESGYEGAVFRRVDGDEGAVYVKSETLASKYIWDSKDLKHRLGTGSCGIRGLKFPESCLEKFNGLDPWVRKLQFSYGVHMKDYKVGGIIFSPFVVACDPMYHDDTSSFDTNRTVLERSSITLSKKVCNDVPSVSRTYEAPDGESFCTADILRALNDFMTDYAACAHANGVFDTEANVFKGLVERSDGSFLPQWRTQERGDDDNILQPFNIKKKARLDELRRAKERANAERAREAELAAEKEKAKAKRAAAAEKRKAKRKASDETADAAKKPATATGG